MRVAAKRCAFCLFGDSPLVEPEVLATFVASIVERDSFFVCHEATAREVEDVMCRGWWENPDLLHSTNPGRITVRLAEHFGQDPPSWQPEGPPVDEDYAEWIAEAKRDARERGQ